MELEFKESSFQRLDCVLHDVKYQEETGEMIVPDSEPDMEEVVASYADVMIRGKDCRNGCVIISGGIKGCVIYRPEDHTAPRNLQFYLPFTVKFENPSLTEQSNIICSAKVRSADGRMLNSRKAMLRVNIGCGVTALEKSEDCFFSPAHIPDALQIEEKLYKFRLPVEYAEKSFVVSDTLEFPVSRPPIVSIVKECCRLEINESKLVGNKGVFKGLAHFKFLYLSEDDHFYSYEQMFPFSQYCEFNNDYDEQALEILPVVTGYDLDPDSQTELRSAQLSIHILVQSVVYDDREVKLIEDAYAIGHELLPQWSLYNFNSQLDEQKERRHLRCQFRGNITNIIDADIYSDYPTVEHSHDEVRISSTAHVRLLAIDENGELLALQEQVRDQHVIALSEKGKCSAQADMVGAVSTSIFSGGAEVCFECISKRRFTAVQNVRTLKGADLKPLDRNGEKVPSIIIQRVSKDTDLWSISKENQSKKAAIRAANQLEGDVITEERFLLIPVG